MQSGPRFHPVAAADGYGRRSPRNGGNRTTVGLPRAGSPAEPIGHNRATSDPWILDGHRLDPRRAPGVDRLWRGVSQSSRMDPRRNPTPMTNRSGVSPILLVRDVVAAAQYYRDKLGFSYDRFWGEPPDFCMVERDAYIVMLSQAPADAELTPHWKVVDQMWNAYFWVSDAEALYEEFQRRGAIIDYKLHLKPYGMKEFGVQDIDGHDLAFGESVEE